MVLKWDCLPFTMIYADCMHAKMQDSDSSSYQSIRKVIQIARDILGDEFYGVVSGSVTVTLPPCACAILSVRKKTQQPQLVSTSRHITQGGADLIRVSYANGVLSGTSGVVRNDPYTITVYDPERGRLLRKTLTPDATGELEWTIRICPLCHPRQSGSAASDEDCAAVFLLRQLLFRVCLFPRFCAYI